MPLASPPPPSAIPLMPDGGAPFGRAPPAAPPMPAIPDIPPPPALPDMPPPPALPDMPPPPALPPPTAGGAEEGAGSIPAPISAGAIPPIPPIPPAPSPLAPAVQRRRPACQRASAATSCVFRSACSSWRARIRAADCARRSRVSAATRAWSASARRTSTPARAAAARPSPQPRSICSTPTMYIIGSGSPGIAPRESTPSMSMGFIGRPSAWASSWAAWTSNSSAATSGSSSRATRTRPSRSPGAAAKAWAIRQSSTIQAPQATCVPALQLAERGPRGDRPRLLCGPVAVRSGAEKWAF
jgi:hypothetical protein